jgi:predicted phage-related endonuclease
MPELTKANMEARKGRVTASQVGILTGNSPWGSPLEVFNWVFHNASDFKTSPAIEMGHRLEPVVIDLGRKVTGRKVRRTSLTRVHPYLPMAATLDAHLTGSKPMVPVEVKTTSGFHADAWALDPSGQGGVPEHYVDQVHVQMMCLDPMPTHAYVWVLIGGQQFHERYVPFDVDRADMIATVVTEFFTDHIIPGIPPVEGAKHPVLFTIPEGQGAADDEMEAIGAQIAGLMGMADGVKEALADERSRLIDRMERAGFATVTGQDWTAELKAGTSGKATLRFNRNKEK